MFIGHYAIGFAAKKLKQSPSLAVMFVAVQLLDLLWPIFVLAGIESFEIKVGDTLLTPLNFTSYPYSHSLLMSVIWGVLLAVIYYLFTKNKSGSLLLAALVFSHWILDFITHRPDLQLSPFSDTKVGLSLWNRPIIETVLEVALYATGVYLYIKTGNTKRPLAFWSLVLCLVAIHFINLFSPPPPSITAVAWSANLMWIFVVWAWWVERPIIRRASHATDSQ